MKHCMNRDLRIWLILATVMIVAVLASVWATYTFESPSPPWRFWERHPLPPSEIPQDIELFYMIETAVSAINMTLSVFLLIIYVSIYRKTRSEFTVGLMIFSAVLLLHAFTSIPLVHRVFGFGGFGLGPFAMLPNLFTFGALATLLYLSFKY